MSPILVPHIDGHDCFAVNCVRYAPVTVERRLLRHGMPTTEVGAVIRRLGYDVVVTKASGPIMDNAGWIGDEQIGTFMEEIEYVTPRPGERPSTESVTESVTRSDSEGRANAEK